MRGSTAGITDGLRGSSRLHYLLLSVLDSLIASLVISPLVVGYWRGTWGLMDSLVFPSDNRASSGVSLGLGLVGIILFTLTQKKHAEWMHPDLHCLTYYFFSRLYTMIFGFVCVNSWRGAWMALDVYTGVSFGPVASITCASIVILVITQTLRNISAPPFTIVTDRYEGFFDVPTMFKTSADNVWLYLLDCSFSVCIVGTLVVFVWRGSWCLLDMFLFNGEPLKSAWASLAIGYGLVFITFALQPPMKYLAKTLEGLSRLAVVDTYLLFSFCGTINVWRGVWNLLNVYAFPDQPLFSYSLTHAVGFIVLVLINSANSILVRGVYIDAEEPGEQCVDFPCYYLRLFFQAKRKKKLIRAAQMKQAEVLAGRKSEVDTLLVDAGSRRKRPSIVMINHHEGTADNV